jgi:hypothetical protein
MDKFPLAIVRRVIKGLYVIEKSVNIQTVPSWLTMENVIFIVSLPLVTTMEVVTGATYRPMTHTLGGNVPSAAAGLITLMGYAIWSAIMLHACMTGMIALWNILLVHLKTRPFVLNWLITGYAIHNATLCNVTLMVRTAVDKFICLVHLY